jgi:hypothetical protein
MHNGSMNRRHVVHDINNHDNSQIMFPIAASEVRKVDPDYVEGPHQTFFSDGYPYLIASQVSPVAVGKQSQNYLYKSLLFTCHLLLSGIIGCTKRASRGTNTYESFQTQVLMFSCLCV